MKLFYDNIIIRQGSQYRTILVGIYRTGQCIGIGTPLFHTRKITNRTDCIPAKTGRSGTIQLFRLVNENNENPNEKNEKQGYPFENPDEKNEKQGQVLWSLAVLCWESEN